MKSRRAGCIGAIDKYQGIGFTGRSRKSVDGLLCSFHGVLADVVARYADPVPYSAVTEREFRRSSGQPDQRRYALLAGLASLAPIEMYTQQFPRFMSEYRFQFPEMRTIRSFAQPGDMDIDSATMKPPEKSRRQRADFQLHVALVSRAEGFRFVRVSEPGLGRSHQGGAEHLRRQMPTPWDRFTGS